MHDRDHTGKFVAKRSPAGRELQPPRPPSSRPAHDIEAPLRRHMAYMDKEFRKAYPSPFSKSVDARLRELTGEKRGSDFAPTPKRRS